ncbi:MAG: polysaccharide deacetylase family protein [Bradymonadaceae bacterium]
MTPTSAERHACVTVDLDTLQCYRDIHGLEHTMVGHEGDPTYTVGLRRIIELFDAMGIPATLFVIGRDTVVPKHHDLLKEADEHGHELGNHTYSHLYDLPERSRSEQRSEIARGEGAIASVIGRRPTGFRAPGYNIDADLLELCRSRQYHYDSSIFPCPPYYLAKGAAMVWKRLRGRPSRSSQTPFSNLFAPIDAYRPDRRQIWRHNADSGMPLEIPMCLVPGLRLPVIGTSLHLLGASGFRALYPLVRKSHPSILNLEFHALDFIDQTDVDDGERLAELQPDLAVPWEKKRALYTDVLNTIRQDYLFATLDDAVGQTA